MKLLYILILFFLFGCTAEEEPFYSNTNHLQATVPAWTNAEREVIYNGTDTEMMSLFTIFNYEDSLVLRQQCYDVNPDSADDILMHLIDRMYLTVNDPSNPGVGIAAPQVGVNRNIIWVMRDDKPGDPFEVCLNPVITEVSPNTTGSNEGCLSIPGESSVITRYRAIIVEYYTLDGEFHRDVVEGFTAKIFQHEIDHLNGILYIDHD